jgi:hypothetical protein
MDTTFYRMKVNNPNVLCSNIHNLKFTIETYSPLLSSSYRQSTGEGGETLAVSPESPKEETAAVSRADAGSRREGDLLKSRKSFESFEFSKPF